MSRIRWSAILLVSIAGALVVAALLAYPLVKGYWDDLEDRGLQARDFVIASDADQARIVNRILTHEMSSPPPCNPSGNCPEERVYFDRLSATLRTLDAGGTWAEYEIKTLRPQGSLIDRADHWAPLPLQELLDRTSRSPTFNPDPMLPGIVYVSDPKDLPVLGGQHSCGASISPKLVRIGRAVLQESEGLALVLVARTFCDGSGTPRLAKLQRQGSEWLLISDY